MKRQIVWGLGVAVVAAAALLYGMRAVDDTISKKDALVGDSVKAEIQMVNANSELTKELAVPAKAAK